MYMGRCRQPGRLLDLASVSAKLLRGYALGFITCEFCHGPLTFAPLNAVVVTFRVGSQLSCPTVGLTVLRSFRGHGNPKVYTSVTVNPLTLSVS